ncbi:MAG: hypothetical protein H7X86_12005 [Gorillibacterium sp.]|nr:hypothetical protein [Gorillibacterium sp.]
MSGFIFGSIVGAVAATYLTRGGKMSSKMPNVAMSGIGASVGKAMSGMMNGNKNMNAQNKSAQNNQQSCADQNQSTANQSQFIANQNQSNAKQDQYAMGLDKVSDLVSKDSFVKAQVNEILCENNQSAHTVR